jgi:hypothetical protein
MACEYIFYAWNVVYLIVHFLRHNQDFSEASFLFNSNHQPDATIFQFIALTFIYSSTCFGRFTVHHQELTDCSGSL